MPLNTSVPIGASITIDVSSAGGLVTLKPDQYARRFLVLTGVPLSGVDLEFPALNGLEWVVVNRATLGVNVIMMHVAGSSVVIVMSEGTQHVWTDGVDLLPVAPLAP